MGERGKRRWRVPAPIVVLVVFVAFAMVMAWAIEGGREFGLLP